MNARRALIVITVLAFALGPLAAGGASQTAPDKARIEAAAAAQAAVPQEGQPAAPAPAKPAAKKPPAVRTEPIVPAYQDIKQKSAVQVFFVWLWLSIGVLLYFLRWWVQEADRVYKAKFYEPVESPRKDNPFPPLLGE